MLGEMSDACPNARSGPAGHMKAQKCLDEFIIAFYSTAAVLVWIY
jgi:hypothetical protein